MPDKLRVEIIRRLRLNAGRGDFAGVHVCPDSSADVPDDARARLVILDPEKPHKRGSQDSAAMKAARDIFESRGTTPRVCRNAVVFLGADEKALVDLHQATAHYLAWKEVDDGWESLNLDAVQKNQAVAKKGVFERTIDLRVGQTWIHGLCPTQAKATAPVKWDEVKVTGNEALADRTSAKLRAEELIVRIRREGRPVSGAPGRPAVAIARS